MAFFFSLIFGELSSHIQKKKKGRMYCFMQALKYRYKYILRKEKLKNKTKQKEPLMTKLYIALFLHSWNLLKINFACFLISQL